MYIYIYIYIQELFSQKLTSELGSKEAKSHVVLLHFHS